MPSNQRTLRRGQPLFLFVATILALILASLPASLPAYAAWRHETKVNSQEYKQQYGHWNVIDLPKEFRLNAIHGALLPTGKVLLVAGSGNNRENFNAYNNEGSIKVLKTVVLDPATMEVKPIETPADLFCAGHTFLQQGNLLVAGGTSGYELMEGDVTKPGGAMIIHNENPDDGVRTLPKGTRFINPDGKAYLSTEAVKLPPAHKMEHGKGKATVHHSSVKVFVEAEAEDKSYVTDKHLQYRIDGLKGIDRQNIYGQGGPMTLNKQDFRGDDVAYEFDAIAEKYIRVGDMKESRWYASLPVMTDGNVLAVSGLDNVGVITETTEWYDPATKQWSWGPDQPFPTYPALFHTANPDVLFYSGSNAGYGPADKGREPGFWNVKTDTFTPVTGLRDTAMLETSGSTMLPPLQGSNDGSQSWRVMVAGGGGIGESELVSKRVDMIDIAAPNPVFTPGPDLPAALRYINLTVTPWDEIFAAGGTADYRSKGDSYSYKSVMINPTTNKVRPMADERVGRGYHSGSLLLPDGRILVFGNDPLFSDKANTKQGTFEQRLEIFTPPQFFRSDRPVATGVHKQDISRGQTLNLASPDPANIKYARLIPPSSTTHVTNIEQRSVGAVVTQTNEGVSVQIPSDKNLLPNGWYMLFVVNDDGMPSVAQMVNVTR
ncbi:MAG TPA: galactose oxidase early set domain-containing protein [Candidatus Saccharimonadales bacterium]|nr:galactose oxidase early set domain-containing protein [Candidatus Saccharimonadales bacterium]